MESVERVTFANSRGDSISGVLHHPAGDGAQAAALLCHGMESDKDSDKIVTLSRRLAQRGILSLRFDFSYAGASSGKFEDITYSGEVQDLAAAFDFVQRLAVEKTGILGSSMGGTVALLFAAQEKRVAALATVAAPLHPQKISENILTPSDVEQWRREGFLYYHGRRINLSLLKDLEGLDVPSAVKKIACPVLILHGDRDDTVPVEEAHELYGHLTAPKRLVILSGADHRLSEPSHLEQAMEEVLNWFSQHLG